MKIKKILLMGNPNVGKSAIFSRLTGAKIVVSNYPGTTVEFTEGYMKIDSTRPKVLDVPGTYTLLPTCKAEEVALQMLNEGDLVINVVNATNLERNLYLTLQLLEKNVPLVIALNMWDETKHQGIDIDVKKLEGYLGVPIVPTCALTGEGIKELVIRFSEAKSLNMGPSLDAHKWERVGKIVEDVQRITHRHHTFFDKIEEFSIKPFSGLIMALGVIYSAFLSVRFLGEGLINFIFNPFFEKVYLPMLLKLSAFLSEGSFMHRLVIGNLKEGSIDFVESFGLLSTGFYVPIAMVLPYIISFYLVLGFLEDLGYLPRLAVLVDNLMHRIGLHGYSIIPMMLGLGCNVPGALAIRILEGRREKFIAATLMAVAVPCMAQIAMIIGLLGKRGGKYVLMVFFILFSIFVIKGLILNKVLKGQSPEILLEIPPYRKPHLVPIIKKLSMRLFGFLKEALPLVLLGVLFVNLLHSFRIIDFLTNSFGGFLSKLWGLPREAMSALVVGFLRKDVAVGMLAPLNLTTKQLIIGCTVLSIYFPCIATFVVLIKELGIKDMFKSALIMISTSLVVGTLLNLLLFI